MTQPFLIGVDIGFGREASPFLGQPLLPSFFPSSYELAHAEGGAEYVVGLFDMHFIAPHGGTSMSSSVHMHTQCNPATISLSEIGLLGA